MNKLRFVHFSDTHLGSTLSHLQDLAATRRREMIQAFTHALQYAQDEKVDFILIPGDFLEDLQIQSSDVMEVIQILREYNHCPIFISPGNHDPYTDTSSYVKYDWPEHVYIFKGEWSGKLLPELDLTVWGAAFTSLEQRVPLMNGSVESWCEQEKKSRWNIGLMHGLRMSGFKEDNYNPITVESIKNSNLDYLALGHIHKPDNQIEMAGEVYHAYSGCLCGRGFDEKEKRGFFLIEMDQNKTLSYEFITIAEYGLFKEVDVQIKNPQMIPDITMEILEQLKEADPIHWQKNYYRIRAILALEEPITFDTEMIRYDLKQSIRLLQLTLETKKIIDIQFLATEKSLRGLFVAKGLELYNNAQTEEEKEKIDQAIIYGLHAFDQENDIIL